MDDLFPLLLFLIFILAPLIEQIRKKGRPPQQRPPTQRPLPGPPPARRSETEEVSGKSADSASVMIPDDLWQILTGERRPPAQSQPAPAPPKQPWDVVYVPPPEEAEADEEALVTEDVNVETRRSSREIESYEEARRRPAPQTLEQPPVIVSLEQEILPAPARHVAFHERLAASADLATSVPQRPAAAPLLPFGDPGELRRAFILQEVLGRPRGLD